MLTAWEELQINNKPHRCRLCGGVSFDFNMPADDQPDQTICLMCWREELIRLARKPDPDGQDERMLQLWLRCQNPTNVSEEGGPSGHSDG